jgi:hypothetical protein
VRSDAARGIGEIFILGLEHLKMDTVDLCLHGKYVSPEENPIRMTLDETSRCPRLAPELRARCGVDPKVRMAI